jgi:isoamylase
VLSAGVPLLLGGDEFGRTQRGNNNAYCQDNEISWFDWSTVDRRLLRFTTELIALRRSHPVFRRRRFLKGHAAGDLRWRMCAPLVLGALEGSRHTRRPRGWTRGA